MLRRPNRRAPGPPVRRVFFDTLFLRVNPPPNRRSIMPKHLKTLVIVALICLALPAAPALAQKLAFSIVTGGTGGVWYPLGGAIGGVIGRNVPNTDATAEVTTAAIDNLKLLCAGKAGLAFAYDYHAVWANDGKIE